MNKKKLLFDNFIIYGVGTVLCNLIPFIMIPVLVRIIPDSAYYFGINDLFNTLVSLMAVFGLAGLYDALFRLFFDYNNSEIQSQKELCSTTLLLTMFFSFICAFLIIHFQDKISLFLFDSSKLNYLIALGALAVILTNVKNIIMTPTRMLNHRKEFVVGNLLSPMASYFVALIIVLHGNYIIALPLGMIMSLSLGILYFGCINRKWFSIRSVNFQLVRRLLSIGIPLFPTFLTFWLFSSLDRIMISKMIGANATGMYAVAGKMAAISQIVTSAFASGWSYFNFSTMNDKNRVKDFSKIIEYLFACGVVLLLVCRLFGNTIMKLLYTLEYENTGSVFAYLFFVPIISMIFQLLCSQFLLFKKTIYSSVISWIGVLINICLNFYWIKSYGIIGASIASTVSYVFIAIMAAMILYRKECLIITRRMEFDFICLCIPVVFDLYVGENMAAKLNFILVLLILIMCSIYTKVLFGELKGVKQ